MDVKLHFFHVAVRFRRAQATDGIYLQLVDVVAYYGILHRADGSGIAVVRMAYPIDLVATALVVDLAAVHVAPVGFGKVAEHVAVLFT